MELVFASLGAEVDDDHQIELILSLNKIIRKNKKVKSLEGVLLEVTNKIKGVISAQVSEVDPQAKEKKVIKVFDNEFTNLSKISSIKAQVAHDAQLFQVICQNIRNDLENLDVHIKELSICLERGKTW